MTPTFIMTSDSSHPNDGVLVAFLDGEAQPEAATEQHVVRCATCASRLDHLRRMDARVSAAVAHIPVPTFDAAAMRMRLAQARAPRPVSTAAWMPRAARIAAVIVLAAGVAWASPAREWFVRRFVVIDATNGVATNAAPAARAPAPNVAGMIVRFAPAGEELVVRLAARPASGALEVQSASDDQVSARITARGANEEMLVLPGELRILNSARSTADYRVTVPSGVARLRVVIAGEEREVVRVTTTTRALIALGRP